MSESNTYFNVSPARIQYGEKAALQWNYTGPNPDSVIATIRHIDTFTSSGRYIVTPEYSRDYECEFRDDSDPLRPKVVTKRLRLHVDPRPEPLIHFFCNQSTVNNGEDVVLQWNVEGEDVASIAIEGVQDFLPRNGSKVMENLVNHTTYTLVVRTYTQEYRRRLDIVVEYPFRPRIINFTASNVEPQLDEQVVLSWSTYSEEQYKVYFADTPGQLESPNGTRTITADSDKSYVLVVEDPSGYIISETVEILPKRPYITVLQSNYYITSINEPVFIDWDIQNTFTDQFLIVNDTYIEIPPTQRNFTFTPPNLPTTVKLRVVNRVGFHERVVVLQESNPVSIEIIQYNSNIKTGTNAAVHFSTSGRISRLLLDGIEQDAGVLSSGELIIENVPRGNNTYTVRVENRNFYHEETISLRGMDDPQIIDFSAVGPISTGGITVSNQPSSFNWSISGDYFSAKIVDPLIEINSPVGSTSLTIARPKVVQLEVQGLNGRVVQNLDYNPVAPPTVETFSVSQSEIRPNESVIVRWSSVGPVSEVRINNIPLDPADVLARRAEVFLSESSDIELGLYNVAGSVHVSQFVRVVQDPSIIMIVEPTFVRPLEIRIAWDVQPRDTPMLVMLHRNQTSAERLTIDGELSKMLTMPKETFKITAQSKYTTVQKSYVVDVLNDTEIRVTESLD